ncbi:MAG TPA: AMP-binding protein [Azospirillaceae bacterium]|nr:AMP-binding protein [Azospirillaceae bacterium]
MAYTAHVDTFARDRLPPRELWPELVFDLPELRYPERLNCAAELLDKAVERGWGDRPCLLTPDGIRWTYADLREKADRIAAVLVEDLGVVPGNRVLLRAANHPMMVACWFAVIKVGAIAVATMPLLRARELAQIVTKAEVSHALCDHRLLDELRGAQSQAPVLRHIVPFNAPGEGLDAMMAGKSGTFPTIETAAEDTCLIAFTSGTTGEPKGCMHVHRDVMAITDCFPPHVLKATPDDLFTGSPPLAFTFGLGGLVLFPMRIGAATLLLERAPPDVLAEAIARHRATVCFTAPTAWRAFVELADKYDLKCLRRCVSAGETLPQATWEAFHRRTGLRIIDGIGATEMLHIFISASDDDIRPGTTGKAVPGYQARIIGPDGRTLPPGEIGRLAVIGPTGCRYLADERQRTYVQGGWNVTGDAYRMDADGYFHFQGRADDMIISAGYNIAGPEVEDALLTHPLVRECGVVGASDPERGTIVKAYVVLAEGTLRNETTVKALQDHVKRIIAPYKYPRAITFVDTLPRTETGKLQRYKLREIEQGRQSVPS